MSDKPDPAVARTLKINSKHFAESALKWLSEPPAGFTTIEYPDGWFIFVGHEHVDIELLGPWMPPSVFNVVQLARRLNCEFILANADLPIFTDLHLHDDW